MRLLWIVFLSVSILNIHAGAAEDLELKSGRDKICYVAGVNLARLFKKQNIDMDLDLVMKGLQDGLSGERLLLSEKEYRQIFQQFQGNARRTVVLDQRVAPLENKTKGTEFLAENKKKEGVVTLASGVQYKILQAANGRQPIDSDTVMCNYRGTLLDGTEFESSAPGKPVTMKVAYLLPGWREAIKLMPVGSRWQIFIPSELAYGERARGSEIVGPNETIILDVELLAIQ